MGKVKTTAKFNKMQNFITDRQSDYITHYAGKWQVNPQEAVRRLLDKMIDTDYEFMELEKSKIAVE